MTRLLWQTSVLACSVLTGSAFTLTRADRLGVGASPDGVRQIG
jgi:hypothetical protein